MLSFFAATKIERQSWQDEKCAVKIQLANSYNPALNMGTIISFIAGEGGSLLNVYNLEIRMSRPSYRHLANDKWVRQNPNRDVRRLGDSVTILADRSRARASMGLLSIHSAIVDCIKAAYRQPASVKQSDDVAAAI
jgi:hypothetical protein